MLLVSSLLHFQVTLTPGSHCYPSDCRAGGTAKRQTSSLQVTLTQEPTSFFVGLKIGKSFTLQEIQATNWQFDDLQQVAALVKPEHHKAEAFSTQPEHSAGSSALPLLALGNSQSCWAERTGHTVSSRLPLPRCRRKRVQLLSSQWGGSKLLSQLPSSCCFWSMEWELLEPLMFYLQGCGQCLPLPVKSFQTEGSFCSRENAFSL